MVDNNMNNVLQYRRDPEIFFNMGLKYASRRDYTRALKFLNEAVRQEPFNGDYQFNLACVHAELKQCKKSNTILLSIVKNIDPTLVECYFGIACNYFDTGNLKKAREYLEKYVSAGEEGEFIEIAYDILYYLQIFEEAEPGSRITRRLSRLLSQGKELINAASYKQACSKLEKVIEIDPFQVSARNYLALACFLDNNVDRALSLARSVLKIEDNNVFAHCNLALFYGHKNMMDECNHQLEIISKIKLSDKEDFRQYIKSALLRTEIKQSIRKKITKALNLEKYEKKQRLST